MEGFQDVVTWLRHPHLYSATYDLVLTSSIRQCNVPRVTDIDPCPLVEPSTWRALTTNPIILFSPLSLLFTDDRILRVTDTVYVP